MVRTSVLNDALNAINNAEKAGKRQVMIRPSSKVIVKFLTVMQKHGTYTQVSVSCLSIPAGKKKKHREEKSCIVSRKKERKNSG
jgi:ribosomal protein S8